MLLTKMWLRGVTDSVPATVFRKAESERASEPGDPSTNQRRNPALFQLDPFADFGIGSFKEKCIQLN